MILRGATLIDGSGAPALRDRAVVVDERRIAAIVPDRGPHDEVVLDLGGLTLLPGLINCHVHLCLSGEADPARTLTDETYAATVVSAVVRARRTVEAGVTTVRDLGGREYAEVAVRDAVRAGVIPGPRVLCAGRAIYDRARRSPTFAGHTGPRRIRAPLAGRGGRGVSLPPAVCRGA